MDGPRRQSWQRESWQRESWQRESWHRGRSSACIAAIAVACVLAAVPLGAQSPAAGAEQRAFTVEHLPLDQAAQRIRTALGPDSGAAIFADRQSGRLLVQATPAQLSSIGELLAQVDQPVAPPAAESPESYLHAYAVAPERRAQARGWADQFQAPAGSRVAFDERTSQLLVMGPPELHRFVESQAGKFEAPAPANPNEPRTLPALANSAPAANRPAVDDVQPLVLKNLTGEALHRRLEQMLSRPLPVTTDNSGAWLAFQAGLTPGTGVTIQVNRQTGDVRLSGAPQEVSGWGRVVRALDAPAAGDDSVTQLIRPKPATSRQVQNTLRVLEASGGQLQPAGGTGGADGKLVTMLFQPRDAGDIAQPALGEAAGNEAGDEAAPGETGESAEDDPDGALLGPVQVQFVEGLDIILIRGNKRDVARVMDIINRIEQVSEDTQPAIEVLPLEHVSSEAMARLLDRVYSQVLGPRTGAVSITALGKPNALLLVGRPENVKTAIELVKRIDIPVEPTTRFEVYPLRYAIAGDVKQLIDAFLEERQQEGGEQDPTTATQLTPQAMVVADFRTNSLIVSAGPRDLVEIEALVKRIDVARGAAVDEVRIFPLQNTLATELAEVLRMAVLNRDEGPAQEGGTAPSARVSAIKFLTIDPQNKRRLESGVLANIRIAADSGTNSLVVTAPSESMELIAALIEQLDRAPNAEAEIKVFTIINGDAVSLAEMLRGLFGTTEDSDSPGFGAGENSLVPLQFSVDERTNSIIAAGTQEDLAVVYAILLQLDASDTRQRRTEVYRLKNSPAEEVAAALNELLRANREAEAAADIAISPFEQIEREVVIVPELVSNSLIVSATPRYFEEIAQLVDELDERPAMVMIQVLIAEVRLNDTDEFGVELGLQDSLLFDRSLLQDFQTISTTTNTQTPGGAVVTTTQDTIVNAPLVPGFNFNNQTLGNNGSTSALATAGNVAAQGLSNFALNRVNSELGFGGFVLSASSNSVNLLLRALQENRRLEVLSRPQIMALDNQIGSIEVGQRVPRVQSTQTTQFGQTNSIVYEPVGIILQVQPRITPDGMVVMQVQAERSEVGNESEGIPIFTGIDGTVVRAPRINQILARTTVAANTGQTVVLSGLLTKRQFDIHRRVPLLSDIPLLGDLFRFDSVSQERTELMIVLTPRVIRNELDAEMLKQVESSRMSWVLCDVVNMHGPSGLRSRCDEWSEADSESVYPTHVPVEGEMSPREAPLPEIEGPLMQREPAPMEVPMEDTVEPATAYRPINGAALPTINRATYEEPPTYQTAPTRLPPVGQ